MGVLSSTLNTKPNTYPSFGEKQAIMQQSSLCTQCSYQEVDLILPPGMFSSRQEWIQDKWMVEYCYRWWRKVSVNYVTLMCISPGGVDDIQGGQVDKQ